MTKFKIRKGEKRQIVIDDSGGYVVELVGEGARVEVLGALVASGNKKLVVDVRVVHKVSNTSSETFIHVVARDKAKVILNGLVEIEKNAQKTEAFLKENVLLLSDKAQAEVIPNLEIEADDVRVSHAATVGRIDNEQIFYLMSRGVSRKVATKMIVEGFLKAVEDKIN